MVKTMYTVYYSEGGEEKNRKVVLTSKRPNTTMAINKFISDMGGLRNMIKYNISIKTCRVTI